MLLNIRENFPFPIAYRFALMQDEINPHRKFLLLLDVFDVVIRYLATVLIAEYVHQGTPADAVDRLHIETLVKKPSLGDWVHLLQERLRFAWNENQPLFMPELMAAYVQEGKQFRLSSPARQISEFVSLRNTYKGHGVVEDEATYARLYRENWPKLEQILSASSFLADYLLVVPFSQNDYRVCRGASPEFFPIDIPLAIEDCPFWEEALWLVAANTGRQLLLWPFSLYAIAKVDEIYFYDGSQTGKGGEIRRAKYLGFQKNIPPLVCRQGGGRIRSNHLVVAIFSGKMPAYPSGPP